MKIYNNLTVILISYKSEKKIQNFVKKIPKNIKVIIIENSKNIMLKKKIEKKYKSYKNRKYKKYNVKKKNRKKI